MGPFPHDESLAALFNLAEGTLWIAVGVGFLGALIWRRGNAGLKLAACALFLTFGLSDFVEVRTGAWFRPWWLAVWKAADVFGLVLVLAAFRRKARAPAPEE